MPADTVPIYPLYALLFVATGLSDAQVSALFAIWSAVAVVAEVPFGAFADRFSRKWSVVGAGADEHFGHVFGQVTAVGLPAQAPAALPAVALFSTGGFALVGWVSVATCLGAALVATRLPEAPRPEPGSYLAVLRSGLSETVRAPDVRLPVLVVAVPAAVDAVEEYFPLIAAGWRAPIGLAPPATVAIPLAGAAGAALGGTRAPSGVRCGGAAVLLGGAGLVGHPAGLAVVAVFYGVYRLVLVSAEARLQARITGDARATVTSVAGLGSEVFSFAVHGAWVVGGVVAVAVLVLPIAFAHGWERTRPEPDEPVVSPP
ncbi:MFS transporter [Saccharothrix sp. HUAS TT1]|uniref:MFS transporter n=1 Tax=unclassified Saccharothrix TaxID=2593673 RepID=UPI00345BBB4B